jgi:hypothetical protein
MIDGDEDRLMKQADLSRARLLAVVDLLDQKREELTHPIRMLKKRLPREPLVYIALGAALFTAVSTVSYFAAKNRGTHVRARLRKRIERATPAQSFWGEVARRSAKALMSFAIARAGKLAIERAGDQLGDEARNEAAF